MRGLRFNQAFTVLMAVAFLMAFILPPAFSTVSVGWPQGLFAPVSRPLRGVARLVNGRFYPEPVTDDRSPEAPRAEATVYQENHQLLSAYASLQAKFEQLSQVNADRQAVGDIRSLCKPATVTGGDATGFHETLQLNTAASAGAVKDRPVIRGNPSQSPLPCDLVGRIVRAGPAGAQVRLVTDPGFRLTARIARYVTEPDGKITLIRIGQLHPLIQGVGKNTMAIQSNISLQEVKDNNIRKDDLILLDDREWSPNLQGFEVGRIVSITPLPSTPILAEIRIEPQTNLMRLTEVMVMVKD